MFSKYYRSDNYLYISFIHFIEKILNPILIFTIVHHDKPNVSRCHESADEPLIKLIHDFQMHVRRFPRMLVHKIERRMSDKLI